MAGDLEAAIDALYAEPPARFTSSRDALAKSLVGKGDKAAAAEVRARRKPSIVAYALNQIARKFPDDVAALVDVGRALARAQRKALRGGPADDLRTAITRQRDALRALVRNATSLLPELKVTAAHLPAITAALQSALVDPAAGEALEAARLDAVPEVATDFLGDISGLPSPVRKRDPEPARTNEKQAAAKARSAERAAAAEKRAATVLAARKAADEAAAAADKATTEARELEKAAKQAMSRARALTKTAERLATAAQRVSGT